MRQLQVVLVTMVGFAFGMVNAAVAQSYSVTDLGTLGGPYMQPVAMNSSGQVTGYANTAGDAAQHAFLYGGQGAGRGTLSGGHPD